MLAGLLVLGSGAGQAQQNPTPTAASQEFNFVVLGDSQFHQPLLFNRLINNVAQLRPGFVVQVGDMIEGYTTPAEVSAQWQRFARQIAPLGDIDFVPVPGNHDLYGSNKRAEQQISDLYHRQWGRQYRSFQYADALFIVLNTDAVAEERQIGPAQFRWLAKTLEAEGALTPIFVFMHRPPDLLQNASALHRLFARYQVNTVFYGHHHHLHQRISDGVRYVMTNAAANSAVAPAGAGGFPHFLHVNVRDGRAHIAAVKADAIVNSADFEPDANYDLMQLTRNFAPEAIRLVATRNGYRFTVTLTNNSRRQVTVLPHCSSADQRWTFTPMRQRALTLAAAATTEFSVTTNTAYPTPGETTPYCDFDMPFQLSSGQWHQHRLRVESRWP